MHLRTVDFAETRKGDKNKTKKKKNKRDRYQRVSHITSQYITLYQKTNSRMVSWFCYL